ncbi:hypothetical protein PILCRDRAFT_821566 [Piloderma croceum F 1598]|uniref:Uncharacterized protein n=1 Tax=Piloderma croceum (strain F 1598) TaxID=765440 RepID=A0A0C3BVS9_PILCF|nr:hypothetical protein PILCRDRAFT_821566 [Piloderma croceum F 1598]
MCTIHLVIYTVISHALSGRSRSSPMQRFLSHDYVIYRARLWACALKSDNTNERNSCSDDGKT